MFLESVNPPPPQKKKKVTLDHLGPGLFGPFSYVPQNLKIEPFWDQKWDEKWVKKYWAKARPGQPGGSYEGESYVLRVSSTLQGFWAVSASF